MQKIFRNALSQRKFANKPKHSRNAMHHDPTQLSLLDEKCILVDAEDREIGTDTKKNCHLLTNINSGMLHRAFSVFLFDRSNKMLLQQRSATKITYPEHWTNSCCSHPLYIDSERESQVGIRKAAIRRLNYELGIEKSQLKVNDIHYITRIQYRADNMPHDGVFGEHEIDYCLIVKGTFELKPNSNEVKAVKFVNEYELKEMIEDSSFLLTPWFRLIADKYLLSWWSKLDRLDSIKDHEKIHRF